MQEKLIIAERRKAYEKVITDILEGKNEQFESSLGTVEKNLFKTVLNVVQEMVEEEIQKQRENVIIDRFYSDIPKKEAIALINEIIEHVDHSDYAAKLVRMFVNNRLPVDRVKRLLIQGF